MPEPKDTEIKPPPQPLPDLSAGAIRPTDLHHRPVTGLTEAQKKKLPSILWYSNAPFVPSGYGQQTNLVTSGLKAHGFDIAIQCNVGLEGAMLNIGGIPIYPRTPNLETDRFSASRIGPSATHHGADLTVCFLDAWAFSAQQFGGRSLPVTMFPVDSEPLPRPVLQMASSYWDRITYSRFGWDMANNAGLDSHYVPHGIRTSEYCPGDQLEARKEQRIGLNPAGEVDPELFIIGCVAANNDRMPTRKGWENIFPGIRLFLDRHPLGKKTRVYVHSWINGPVDLEVLADSAGVAHITEVVNQNRLMIGLSTEAMAQTYRAMDVLLSVGNEGFGLPIVEAQACSVPVITGDWTAAAELSFAGVRIPKSRAWKFPTHLDPNAFWYIASPEAICEALCAVADARSGSEWRTWQEDARQGAEAYDIDAIVRDFWVPTLISMHERGQAEKAVATKPRPARDSPKDYTELCRADSTGQDWYPIIVAPSKGEKCGIAEYAKSAYRMLWESDYRPAVYERVDTALEIAARMESEIVANHEYAFFDKRSPVLGRGESTQEVLESLYQYHQNGGKAAIILHTVSPRGMEIAPNQLIKEYSEKGLPIFATTYAGAVYAGVRHCPLGAWTIPGFTPSERVVNPEQPFIIGNFGFAQGHKDFGAQVSLCKATDSIFLGSFACEKLSMEQQLRTALYECGLPHAPILFTDFAEDIALLERLSLADVFYMPRPPNDLFYSSASVITAMNAHRPVIINREECYRDLWDTLIVADSVEEAAAAIEALRDPIAYSAAVERIKEYLDRRNVAKVWKEYGVI